MQEISEGCKVNINRMIKDLINYFRNNKILQIVLIVWLVIGYIVMNQIPYDHFCHDCQAHWEYTKILVNEHRLPNPNEGWEMHQQPIYYLIASLIAPKAINYNVVHHVNCVRILSLVFGAITLIILTWFLQKFTENKFVQLLVLLFIETTPKFVFVFSTYNNDSMTTMLAIAIIALSYKIYHSWSRKLEVLLFVVALISVFTKLTILIPIFAVIFICSRNFIHDKPLSFAEKRIVITLVVPLLILTPYTIIHNYSLTGKLFPSLNFTSLPEALRIGKDRSLLRIMLPTSILDTNMWGDPIAHPYPDKSSKRNSYLAYNYTTSVYGEHDFNSPSYLVLWLMLLIHFFVYIVAITKIFESNFTKIAGSIILFAHLVHLAHNIRNPYSCNMDFRYIAWIWIAWMILYASACLERNKWYSGVLNKVFILGIVLNFYFITTVVVR